MAGLELFQPLSLVGAARFLEVHPFELVRILVACDALPADLTMSMDEVDAVRGLAGLERWWDDGSLDAIEPIYGPAGLAFARIEAGHMTHLLERSGRAHGVAVRQERALPEASGRPRWVRKQEVEGQG